MYEDCFLCRCIALYCDVRCFYCSYYTCIFRSYPVLYSFNMTHLLPDLASVLPRVWNQNFLRISRLSCMPNVLFLLIFPDVFTVLFYVETINCEASAYEIAFSLLCHLPWELLYFSLLCCHMSSYTIYCSFTEQDESFSSPVAEVLASYLTRYIK